MTRPESSRRGVPCRIAIRSRLSSRTGYFCPGCRFRITPHVAHMPQASQTHIGEYDAKTNAIWCLRQAPERIRSRALWQTIGCERGPLLSVGFQHRIAGNGNLGTIFLQARQNGEITLIDHRAAEALHVSRASLLFLRRAAALRSDWLGGRPTGNR